MPGSAARVEVVAPADETAPHWRYPDRGLLRLHRFLVALLGVPVVLLAVVVLAVERGGPEAVAGGLIGVVLLGMLLRVVRRHFEALGYAEREDDLLIRRGILVRRLSVVPFGRMQYVDVTAGPLDRRFGLSTVVLHTAAAATDARVPGLLEDEATRLRDRLAALGEARAAGV